MDPGASGRRNHCPMGGVRGEPAPPVPEERESAPEEGDGRYRTAALAGEGG